MTRRALLIGLVGALFIAGFGYINNQVLKLEPMAAGGLIPVSVLGVLLVFSTVVNPLLFRVRPGWALGPAELGLIAALLFIACSIPGRGLMEQFTTSIILPHHWERVNPGWKRHQLVEQVPDVMLVGDEKDPAVLEAFIMGKGTPGNDISLSEVPWRSWRQPLLFWGSLVLLMAAAVIGLSLIVHKQWVEHEQLPYPIATFTAELLDRPDHAPRPKIFDERLFWIGFGAIFAIRVWNGLYAYFPDVLVPVRLGFSFHALTNIWPPIRSAPWAGSLFGPTLYPVVLGFAYFLASEISFTIGISQFLFIPLAAVLVSYGVEMQSSYMAGGAMGWHRAGAYVAFAGIIAYTGRRYYSQVLRRVVGRTSEDEIANHVVWAGRIVIIATITMIGMLSAAGLDWTLSTLTILLILVMFLGVSRISAETGAFFIHPRWQPMGILLGALGPYACGPQGLIVVGLVCVVLSLDPSTCLMAYFGNGLRVCDRFKVSRAAAATSVFGTYAACIVLAFVVVLWAQYNYGCTKYVWSFRRVPTMPFRHSGKAINDLDARGVLEESAALGPLQRLTAMRPQPKFLWAAGLGFALVIAFSSMRLRYPWWPLHPVLFLVVASYANAALHHSFLLGWIVKAAVTKYGGSRLYNQLKPLMIGIIAGDLAGVFSFMLVGACNVALTGTPPPAYTVFPR